MIGNQLTWNKKVKILNSSQKTKIRNYENKQR